MIFHNEFWQIGVKTVAQRLLIAFRASTMAPEPESTKPEPESTPESSAEPKTLFPEIMTNQEAFLMYGVFIFALAVFCVVLLVLYIMLKKKLVQFCLIVNIYNYI